MDNNAEQSTGQMSSREIEVTAEGKTICFDFHEFDPLNNAILVYLPGYEDDGKERIKGIVHTSTLTTQPQFNALVPRYPIDFDVSDIARSVGEYLKSNPYRSVIFHAYSVGGIVLNEILSSMEGQANIGLIYEAAPLAREDFSPLIRSFFGMPTDFIRFARHLRNLQTRMSANSEQFMQMTDAIPQFYNGSVLDLSPYVITYEGDKVLDLINIRRTYSRIFRKPKFIEVGVFCRNLGHTPQENDPVFKINREIIDELIRVLSYNQ